MNKGKAYIIPIITIIIFIGVMTSGGFLKKSFNDKDNVINYIDIIKQDITNENWNQAGKDLEYLKNAWNIVGKRVQFSVERNEMIMINTNIARLEGAIWAKDKSEGLIEISEIIEHWRDLEK
ncbi:DUF4363 family protein [Clostridium brassicae]|uniref:DUF4363 family protein n=1 Tax=Clostridium brassicae TaxID=2999072 RepID=A0ABT4DDA0_9CLOT|nr:DUF4363 family protein [Clostridium brassicae]MCY6960298.1 DUF4363 family protein [Clostridium brassicae]